MAPLTCDAPAELGTLAGAMRRRILEQSFRANVGHIGSALCVVDVLAALWGRFLRAPASAEPNRDRFILCKGHAALALYAVMRELGHIDEATFKTFCQDGSLYGAHPEYGIPGVEVSTGSLGQGLSVACGLALALRRRSSSAKVVALLSDAECNEGQVWEAAQFAAHHRLANLIVIVDCNGMQAMGPTEGIIHLDSLARRWASFDWHAAEVDGHDLDELALTFDGLRSHTAGPPVMIAARTLLGKGVSFMEHQLDWHYRNLTPELFAQALAEVGEHP